ncbi:MAG: PKD domain-containing protein [Candidatus Eisenbacteria bacterium]|mgnify:CR=1 FL=1
MVRRPGSLLFPALLIVWLAAPSVALAQYIFLDANGDGVRTASDLLPPGVTTTIDIRLVTNRNRDGSAATCAVDSSSTMTFNSYEVILRTVGGTVEWGVFTNLVLSATTSFGSAEDPREFYSGFGGGEILPPGGYLLGRVEITPATGTPSIVFAANSRLNPPGYTSFGSKCRGIDGDNTLKLGVDWADSDGLSAPNISPVPVLRDIPDLEIAERVVGTAVLSAEDADGSLLSLVVSPTLSFARYVQKFSDPGYIEGTLTFVPGSQDAGTYTITVLASDGTNTASQTFTLRVVDVSDPPQTNSPPVWASLPDVSVQPGLIRELPIWVSDPDRDSIALFLSGAPRFASLRVVRQDPGLTEGVIRLVPSALEVGTYSIVLTAADATHFVAGSFRVTVGANHLPEFVLADSLVVQEGEILRSRVDVTDADSDPLRLDLARAPAFLTVAEQLEALGWGSLAFALRPLSGDAGSHPFVLAATDGYTRVEFSFPITVLSAGPMHVTWSPASLGCVEQRSTRYAGLDAEAASERPLTLELTAAPPWITVESSRPNMLLLRMSPPESALPGIFSVLVTAIDSEGNRSQQRFEGGLRLPGDCICIPCLSVPPRPIAVAGRPYAGFAGLPVQFDGRWTSTGGYPASFAWTFGDGQTSNRVVVEHRYASGGRYRVTLRVSNSGGTSRDSTEAIIADAIPARAFMLPPQRVLALRDANGFIDLHVEPAAVPFDLAGLRLDTAVLRTGGLGATDSILTSETRRHVSGDSDRNGVPDATVSFGMADLVRLFSAVRGKRDVSARLEIMTMEGALVRGEITLHVLGDPRASIAVGPNPFNPTGSIQFDVASPGRVHVRLYDVSGRFVRTLLDEARALPGLRVVPVDGRDASGRPLASGVYFFKVERGQRVDRGRVTLLK